MAREGSSTDFTVTVENVGIFTFGRRTMRDEIKIQVEYARKIEGVTPTAWLAAVAGWIATLEVMTVISPPGWVLDELDPLDDATYAKLQLVNEQLSAKELSFRPKRVEATEAAGESSI